jgi:hypothetical protein
LRAGGLLVGGDPFLYSRRDYIVALATTTPFRQSMNSANLLWPVA